MGIPVELAPHLTRLMSREDAARYDGDGGAGITNKTHKTSRKRDADERREQGDFANWLLLQNSQGRKIPFSLHATHTRSRATPGTPDFYVGINGRSLWIEFNSLVVLPLNKTSSDSRARPRESSFTSFTQPLKQSRSCRRRRYERRRAAARRL